MHVPTGEAQIPILKIRDCVKKLRGNCQDDERLVIGALQGVLCLAEPGLSGRDTHPNGGSASPWGVSRADEPALGCPHGERGVLMGIDPLTTLLVERCANSL